MNLLRPRSLQLRLAIRLGLLFLAATALAVGALAYETYRTAASLGEQNLIEQARTVARSIEKGHDGKTVLRLPAVLSAVYDSPTLVAAYAVRDGAGHTIATSSADLGGVAAGRAPPGRKPRFFRLDSFGFSGRDYYGVDVELDSAAGPVLVTVAEAGDVDDLLHAVLEEFFVEVAWIIPVFVAATLLVGVLAIRGGLRPVRRVSAEAAMIGPGATSLRLSQQDLPSEIEPLVAAVNQALDRLDQGFVAQRRFTANAAHELRTPLTIVSAALEALEGNGELAKLRQDVTRMNRLVDQLLRVARLDSLELDVSAEVDLSEVAREVVEYMAPLAIAEERALALVGAEHPVRVKGNRHAIADALRNLIENAIHHTRPRTEVTLEIDDDGSVSVSDSGPGIRPEDRETVFDRFWRGQCSLGLGAGLGLAIVRETMHAHGGTVDVSDSSQGGARFTLRFRRSVR